MKKNISILIVEDELLIALRMKLELINRGYTICDTTAKGEEAVEIAKKKSPNIILMDINLQGKMDGIDTAREILSFSTTSIIFVTGYPDEELRLRAEKLKPAGYLLKPATMTDITSAINFACGQK